MSVVVEFRVPAAACALGRSLGGDPTMTLEVDRVIPTGDTVMPFFWVWGGSTADFEAAAREEPAIETLSVVETVEGGTLFSAEWDEEAAGTLKSIVDVDGAILEAHANCTEWTFVVRFAGAEETKEFRQSCDDRDVPIDLRRVTSASERRQDKRFGLTPEQAEAMAVAYRSGYFDEPRSATLDDLAAKLGISPRAVTGRLRRGQAKLIERTGIGDLPVGDAVPQVRQS